jgi:hypothetical protein
LTSAGLWRIEAGSGWWDFQCLGTIGVAGMEPIASVLENR